MQELNVVHEGSFAKNFNKFKRKLTGHCNYLRAQSANTYISLLTPLYIVNIPFENEINIAEDKLLSTRSLIHSRKKKTE